MQAGDPITLYLEGALVFAGTADEDAEQRLAPASDTETAVLEAQVSCTDWHQLLDRIVVAEAYSDTDAETILRDLWAEYLEDEGITLGTLSGLGVAVTQAVFNYITMTECLEALAEKTGCYWILSAQKVLTVAPREESLAPWSLTSTAPVFDVQVRRHREQYRNRQFLTGARAETSEQTEEFLGDGKVRTFTVGYPISRTPTVLRNGVAQTVGLKNGDTAAGTQWLWAQDDPVITQGSEEGITSWPVTGAGSTEYDGLYVVSGEFGGKPAFTDGTRWLFWADAAGLWCLAAAKANLVDGADAAYYGTGADLPANNWNAGTGTGPAPALGDENAIYIVAGAGSPGFNGTYRAGGTFGTKPYYQLDDNGPFLFWADAAGEWCLDAALTNHVAATSAAYYGTDDGLPGGAWHVGQGASGAPSVTADTEIGPRVDTNQTLTAGEVLTVEYIGVFDLVLRMDRTEEVAARAAIEGGTGIYSGIRQESGLWELGTLVTLLENDLRRFAFMGTEVDFSTYTAGLGAGQLLTVNLPEHSFTGEVLITGVTLEELLPAYGEQVALYAFRVKAVSGEAVGGWIEFFRRWDRPATIGNLLDGQPETIVRTEDPFLKVWSDNEHPNPFYRLNPATDLYPSTTLYPQFAPRYEIRYLAAFDGETNEVARRAVTSLWRYTATEIATITLLGPSDYSGNITHLGWYGGDGASETAGSGVLLEKVAYATSKTALEGLLFSRRDIYGTGAAGDEIDAWAALATGLLSDAGEDFDMAAAASGGDWTS
jgi:hypothetical protein